MKFVYITKKHSGRANNHFDEVDVGITYSKTRGKCDLADLRISFSESIKTKAFKNCDYLICCYTKEYPTRIWFKEADKKRGYKLSKPEGHRYVFAPTGLAKIVGDPERFCGEHELRFDPYEKMWFIDLIPNLRAIADELKKVDNT